MCELDKTVIKNRIQLQLDHMATAQLVSHVPETEWGGSLTSLNSTSHCDMVINMLLELIFSFQSWKEQSPSVLC